ncbi:MAG: Mrp/NBP35 family ATP-binding protein, partial [Chlorobium limicola]|nr:Mrp/NBP35 family ATP-binding protein [Chlorobium limicola]
PIGREVREGGDSGKPFVLTDPGSVSSTALSGSAREVARQISIANACCSNEPS